jgi:hypothetical protein
VQVGRFANKWLKIYSRANHVLIAPGKTATNATTTTGIVIIPAITLQISFGNSLIQILNHLYDVRLK